MTTKKGKNKAVKVPKGIVRKRIDPDERKLWGEGVINAVRQSKLIHKPKNVIGAA